MKPSSKILLAMLILLVSGLLMSNMVLKKEYNRIDKSDLYWNYTSVFSQPFKYLKIDGGNDTRIAFEQSKNYSVRVLNDWKRGHPQLLQPVVKNDTLFIKFVYKPANPSEKSWMKSTNLVRIFSPGILSVQGFNTNFGMFKIKQKSISVSMSGKSIFELESMIPEMDSINVVQRDSAEVEFEMSPDYRSAKSKDTVLNKSIQISFGDNQPTSHSGSDPVKSDESMTIHSVKADLTGHTILDIGHAQIQLTQLHISDSSAIVLSGGALANMGKLKQ